MSHNHSLGGVGNKIARYKRILHSDVSHRNTVTNGNSREHYGSTARHGYAKLYSLRNFIKIHVPGNDLVVRANYTDKRTGKLLLRKTERVVKRTVGRVMRAVYYCIFDHNKIQSAAPFRGRLFI